MEKVSTDLLKKVVQLIELRNAEEAKTAEAAKVEVEETANAIMAAKLASDRTALVESLGTPAGACKLMKRLVEHMSKKAETKVEPQRLGEPVKQEKAASETKGQSAAYARFAQRLGVRE